MTMAEAICCTLVNCNCDSFKPGKLKRRQCETCKHGWVSHALSKLKVHHKFQSSQVEIVHSNVVFDICSLMLYGTQAIPVRLKILLDRLFSVLKQEEVIQILSALDWTLQDYIRGYVLQDVAGKVLDRWAIMTFEEEIATLQQFLRFGETKSIVELMALQDKEGQVVLVPNTLTNSDIRNFIERNTPRSAANLCTSKAENMSGGSMHHFENFINSMAFMLPFQLLGSAPAPFLGSPLQQQHQPCGVSLEQQGQRRDDQGRDNAFPLLHPSLNSFVGSSSIPCSTDLDHSGGNPVDSLSTTAKIEAEDFSISDNYSDRSSTPCTPSLNSDVPQMSPDGKLHSLDRSGSSSGSVSGGAGSLKKGRVFCSACEKTFYDKGTLKIHYNAVHLKIKHKCTIEGCNMVFSSLRSRNRHSANPNPRLHMPMNRNNRDKDLRSSLSADESSQGEKKTEYGNPISICSAESQRPVSSYVVSHVDSGPKLHGSSFPSSGQSGVLFSNLKTVQPVLPFYRSLVTPAELANTPGTLPSLPILSSSVPIKAIAEPKSCVTDLIPKKKSRKSSMPIKIEKDTIAHADQIEKTSSSEEELPFQASDMNYESSQAVEHRCTRQPGQQKDARDAYVGKEKEGEGIKNSINHTFDRHLADNEQKKEEGSRPAKTVVIDRTSSPSENSPLDKQNNSSLCQEPSDSEDRETREHTHSLNLCDKRSEVTTNEGGYKVTNGGSPQPTERGGLDDSGLSHFDSNLSPPCEVCSKPFKNPFSIRMHYQDVHLKEMHMCTVDGCNATFPSRRSRDRMTRPAEGSSGEIFPWKYLFQFLSADYRPASPSPAPAPPRRRRRPRPSASVFLSTLPEAGGRVDGESLPDCSSYVGTRLAVCSPGVGPRRGERCQAPPQPCVPGRSCNLAAAPARRSCLDTSPVRPAVPSPAESAPAGGGAAPAAQLTDLASLRAELVQIRQTLDLDRLQLDDPLAASAGRSSLDLPPVGPAVPPPVRSAPLSSAGGGAMPTTQPTELASLRAELVQLQ
uniref:Basonuclin zinc finger protein 1 n=1 Tax=Nothobranchius furzeri TaxID=105023 RepID=A0A8C6M259_NOTFU